MSIGIATQPGQFAAAAAGGGGSALLTDLVAYWPLDEVSDGSAPVTRADAHGSIDLTDVGTVASTTGLITNAARFVSADGTYLTVTNSALNLSGSFSISAWVYWPATPVGFDSLVTHRGSGAGKYGVSMSSAEKGFGYLYDGTFRTMNFGPVFASGTWYHVALVWDETAGEMRGFVDNVKTAASLPYSLAGASKPFNIGSYGDGNELADADICEVGLWNRALTDAEVSQLYASGSGLAYPFS